MASVDRRWVPLDSWSGGERQDRSEARFRWVVEPFGCFVEYYFVNTRIYDVT